MRICAVFHIWPLRAAATDSQVEALARVALSAGPSGTPSDPAAREGVRLAASALVDPRREVRKAALGALAGLSGQSFGLKPGRAPSDDELESAIRRAQIWWNEHEREYRPAEPPRTPPAP